MSIIGTGGHMSCQVMPLPPSSFQELRTGWHNRRPAIPCLKSFQAKYGRHFRDDIRSNFGFLNRTSPETADLQDKFVTQAGNRVFKDIIVGAGRRIRRFLDQNEVSTDEVHRFWLQQSNSENDPRLIALHRPCDRARSSSPSFWTRSEVLPRQGL